MSSGQSGKAIVVFGAGGRAGRAAVGEGRRRGYQVTAVVRDPGRHPGLGDSGARVVAGDVTDPARVAALAAGHDAAIHAAAVYGEGTDPDAFFTSAAHALVEGLSSAEVPRLVAIGLSTLVPGGDGVRPVDAASFPAEYRPFSLAHAAGLEVLREHADGRALDWVCLAPAGDFDHDAGRSGRYVIRAHGDPAARISYPDFAIALLDQIDAAAGNRSLVAVSRD
ncbi:NAD(P)-dependent oxidoreductase [Actinospica robiniae]|uniref:NAD(P)-dependent oxidoreductase n=1 Tax=Actinospica robiniae TaxID=304901 RepID=UPI000407A3B9|nr:NAD(P)H-binding protein [Actinospica robiniae]